jgi:hypothetical protein
MKDNTSTLGSTSWFDFFSQVRTAALHYLDADVGSGNGSDNPRSVAERICTAMLKAQTERCELLEVLTRARAALLDADDMSPELLMRIDVTLRDIRPARSLRTQPEN